MSKKWVYYFGKTKSEGDSSMKEVLGGKGANLAEMINIGIPVPPGFTISTEVCKHYFDNDMSYPEELNAQVEEAMKLLEKDSGKKIW